MASFLRNRFWRSESPASTSPVDDDPPKAEEVRLAPVSKIITNSNHGKHHRPRKRRTGLIFGLGGLFGIIVAGYFANESDLINIPEFGDMSMDSLADVLPAGFMKEARNLAVCGSLLEGTRLEGRADSRVAGREECSEHGCILRRAEA